MSKFIELSTGLLNLRSVERIRLVGSRLVFITGNDAVTEDYINHRTAIDAYNCIISEIDPLNLSRATEDE